MRSRVAVDWAVSSKVLRVLVTGASRGIGLELVRQYLAAGARVFAAARDPEVGELRALAATMAGERLTRVALDVTSEAQGGAAAAAVGAVCDGLDVLVNNAGRNAKGVALTSAPAEQMLDLFRLNAVAPVLVARAFLPLLRRGRAPRIVNVSTQVGSFGWNRHGQSPLYAASKAALNMYTRALARELPDVTVVAVHPGWVRTDMGGASAPLAPAESVEHLRRLIARVTPADTGQFFDHDGSPHPF
jgi:NAD(P)-dependent dehydrogenase (short-subunit alcohol dehydrogenase family)